MADESKTPGTGPFDLETVRRLVKMMSRFDLSEVDLTDGGQRIRLRRGARVVTAALPTIAAPAVMPGVMPASPANSTPAAPPEASKKYLEIKSPMVGTFYTKPAPDKDDYVKVGSRVAADTIVCKVEAMKIFNDLPAGVAGTITEVLVENGGFVEYDQVLFRVDPG